MQRSPEHHIINWPHAEGRKPNCCWHNQYKSCNSTTSPLSTASAEGWFDSSSSSSFSSSSLLQEYRMVCQTVLALTPRMTENNITPYVRYKIWNIILILFLGFVMSSYRVLLWLLKVNGPSSIYFARKWIKRHGEEKFREKRCK